MSDGSQRTFVARRFDGLGGRLTAMVNALALADLLGGEFHFAWVATDDLFSNDPTELFDRSFLAAHQVSDEAIAAHHVALLSGSTPPAANGAHPAGWWEVDWPIGLHPLLATHPDGVARFAAAFRSIPLSPALAAVSARADELRTSRFVGVHLRAGDVVSGAWRRGTWHQKYQPLSLTTSAIADAVGTGARVMVVSDDERIASYVVRRTRGVGQLHQLCDGYAALSELQRALADLLLLSACATIIAPSASAFSTLASLAGGGELRRNSDHLDGASARAVVSAGVRRQQRFGHRRRLALHTARDLVWLYDVVGGDEPAAQLMTWMQRACRLDPEFTAAWARLARAAAREGRFDVARDALARATESAARDTRQDDVLVELDVAEVVVGCCDLLWRELEEDGTQRHEQFAHLRACVLRCASRSPHHFQGPAVAAMSTLVELVGEVAVAPPHGATPFAAPLRRALQGPLSPDDDGYQAQRDGRLDPWAREVTALLTGVCTAVGRGAPSPSDADGTIE